MGLVTDAQVTEALAEQWGMPVVNLEETTIPPKVIEMVPQTMAEIYKIMPISLKQDVLTVAMAEPAERGHARRPAELPGRRGPRRRLEPEGRAGRDREELRRHEDSIEDVIGELEDGRRSRPVRQRLRPFEP